MNEFVAYRKYSSINALILPHVYNPFEYEGNPPNTKTWLGKCQLAYENLFKMLIFVDEKKIYSSHPDKLIALTTCITCNRPLGRGGSICRVLAREICDYIFENDTSINDMQSYFLNNSYTNDRLVTDMCNQFLCDIWPSDILTACVRSRTDIVRDRFNGNVVAIS